MATFTKLNREQYEESLDRLLEYILVSAEETCCCEVYEECEYPDEEYPETDDGSDLLIRPFDKLCARCLTRYVAIYRASQDDDEVEEASTGQE